MSISNANLKPSDVAAIVGAIDPDATTAGTVTTGWIAAADFKSFMGIVMAGTLGASATVDAKFQQATDAAGTGVKDVAGTSITQLTAAGTDSDKQAIINLSVDDLDIANAFTHIRLSVSIAVATSDAGALVLGFNPGYGPASTSDAATVDEIVN